MNPKARTQAYEECSRICNEQLRTSEGVKDAPIKWSAAVEMCQRLMIVAWLRGFSAATEILPQTSELDAALAAHGLRRHEAVTPITDTPVSLGDTPAHTEGVTTPAPISDADSPGLDKRTDAERWAQEYEGTFKA